MTSQKVEQELMRGPDASVVSLIDLIIEHAIGLKASDIHIIPALDDIKIRIRVDGILKDVFSLPKNIQSELITRIKVLTSLRTDEHQTPQDGRFKAFVRDSQIDIRVSIIPTYFGENAILRILTDNIESFELSSLGFEKDDVEKIIKSAKKNYGMILATGPTGSGKTTTLYTILKMLNTRESSIVTIEDPIEYAIPNITQIQINQKSGLTFANGLRSILRQDPDIIMVGEIRDMETANIAVNTALTGHLLLSTLHTNDSATTLPRLLDLKVEPFLIASTVNVSISQRLVRKICENCKIKRNITQMERSRLLEIFNSDLVAESDFYYGGGCDKCSESGYSGRFSINEVLAIDDEIQNAILKRSSAGEIKKIAVKNGMTTMVQDGLKKAGRGLSTIEEILRVCYE